MKANKIFWYARARDIKYMGPFTTQLDAFRATIGLDGLPVEGAFVWCTDKEIDDKKEEEHERENTRKKLRNVALSATNSKS